MVHVVEKELRIISASHAWRKKNPEADMKTIKAKTAILFVVTLAFAALAGAQRGGGGPLGGMMGPQVRGLFNPVVGGGAQYEVQQTGGKKLDVEIDLLGKESVNGKDGYWIEITTSDTPMGQVVLKTLTAPDGSGISVSRTIMQMGGGQPMEMPQMGRASQQTQNIDIRNNADKVGSESVTTPAGTFTADHYRAKDGTGDFWLSEKVSPYGLIKSQDKDRTIVLTKVVTDAKDRITGTPVPFNPAVMMQGGQAPR